jgi:cytochrome c-type biogenesis protein CcmH
MTRRSFAVRHLIAALVATLVAIAPAVHAVTPDEMLSDPKLEARARDISLTLRCVVCQNQSIDDSSAPLAKDLRVLVRERLAGGDTDAQATEFIVARYGNFVLLKPPLQSNTLMLWFGPLLIAALAVFGALRVLKSQAGPPEPGSQEDLTAAERHRLDTLLEEGPRP